ncbi:adenylylsulfate kinase-like enzyme [Actinoplanes lutulentus]|uniref:Adenylylsulfate kinase n=1 Tax=Actinoplanes lutulentus TaxID=1287878 RepID=A0A327Z3T7_9ACTN|nr:adenylyl-sulfate kinase [Actinoplanes lutulentus]MBB2948365.1 adenylylsulfate kinase-like enzyme [Actinoplanes lutulentus]RAK30397.1 adenylylsulfate kinase [Actinoplanes lutulentus]
MNTRTPGGLLVTGTVGAGKTAVAEALGDLLAERGVPHAVIDVDWLRRSWPSPPDDPFNSRITLRNLRAVAHNFVNDGARLLVLAGVVESRAERDRYQDAIGVPMAVCRLGTSLEIVRERLRRRHRDDPAGLAWHLQRCGTLDRILREASVEDAVVDGGHGSPRDVAAAITRSRCINNLSVT